MRNFILAFIAIGLAASGPVLAGEPSKEENIGVGTGGVIGAIAGGPVGFIVGAAIGAKLGDNMHEKNESIESLQGELEASNIQVETLNSDLMTLDQEITRLQAVSRPQLTSLMQAGIATDLLFRTDEYVLNPATGSRLDELAAAVASMPDVRVQLDGFADERGDEHYNYSLSQRRIETIRDLLIGAGVEPSRINSTAHGESPAADATADSYALERRVSLTLFIDELPSFASNPE